MTNKTREQVIEKLGARRWSLNPIISRAEALLQAKEDIELLESLGYVQKDPDQSLPKIEVPKSCKSPEDYKRGVRNTLARMLNNSWVKIEKLDCPHANTDYCLHCSIYDPKCLGLVG